MAEVVREVSDLISSFSKDIGSAKEKQVNSEFLKICNMVGSPIEQILYCALKTMCKINRIDDIKIVYQYKIGKYRVDFFISNKKSVVVECDSQQFHERTEEERRYEKARDRFLQKKGYKIFHYTGADIKSNYKKIVREIIRYALEREQ